MSERTRQTSLPGFDSEEERRATGTDLPAAAEGATEPLAVEAAPSQAERKSDCPHGNESGSEHQLQAASEANALAGKTVWVIDAHSLIHQVFHALPEMKSPRGEPMGAVFGFTRDLLYLLEQKRPDYLFCAFDLPGGTFRHVVYGQYKVQRAEMPSALVPQIPTIRRVLAALGVPALECVSYEADDILATVARLAEERGAACFVVSNDKDCRQLITDRVAVYNIRKDEVFDALRLEQEWGISPSQVVDYQALVGDSVDNVPGVPLIGPKFAKQLLLQYGTLDAILAHAGEAGGGKRGENLVKYRDQALLSRELVRLHASVPLEINWNACRAGRIDRQAAHQLFAEFRFRSMGEKLDAMLKASG